MASLILRLMRLNPLIVVAAFGLIVSSAQAQVNCPPQLPLTLLGNTEYCIGSIGSELSIEQNYAGYEWLPTSETAQSVTLTAGSYWVVVTHYTGCTDTLQFQVAQVSNPPQPTIDVSGPTQFCEGESVTLSVPTWYPYYEWSTGSVSDEITVYESGTYNVSIEDWIGCSSSSNSIQVIVNPLPEASFSPNLNLFDVEFDNFSMNATDYEWNFGDGNFSTDFEPTHTYGSGGVLPMWLVAFNDCGSDTAFLDLASVGIGEKDETLAVGVYPNPCTGKVWLSLGTELDGMIQVAVLNSLGAEVLSQPVFFLAGKGQVDVGSLPNGSYIMQIRSESSSYFGRIMVSR